MEYNFREIEKKWHDLQIGLAAWQHPAEKSNSDSIIAGHGAYLLLFGKYIKKL